VIAWMLPFSAVYSVWPIYVANVQGLGAAGYSRLWGLAAFLEVPSMLIAGWLADRLGRRTMFASAMVLFAGIYVAYALAPAPWGLVAAQVVRGFAYAAFTATALTAVVELAPPTERGRAAGVYQLSSGLAQIAGNSSGGPVSSWIGFPATFLGAAAVTLAGAASIGARRRR
jgi:predicted MFS family arabinose efflux permease